MDAFSPKQLAEIKKLLENAFLIEWQRNDGKFMAGRLFRTRKEAGRFEGILTALPGYELRPLVAEKDTDGFGIKKIFTSITGKVTAHILRLRQ